MTQKQIYLSLIASFQKLSPRLLLFSIALVLILSIFGCISGGIQSSTGEPVTDLFETFLSGEARLACQYACSGKWGSMRKKWKSLYDNGLWKDLAVGVAKVGHESDLSYFYLGRAAEGLGQIDSARTYYKLATTPVRKCHRIVNNCSGFVFPKDILARLDNLPSDTNTTLDIIGIEKFLADSKKEKNPTIHSSEASQKQTANSSTDLSSPSLDIIGKWHDPAWPAFTVITIYHEKGILFMEYEFGKNTASKGSTHKKEMISEAIMGQTRFRERDGNPHGDYYVIDKRGNLGIYDGAGFIRTALSIQ